MLLSHRHKFLFVHIAKTGGTSARAALARRMWLDPYRLPMFVCSKLSHLTGHRLGAKFPRHAKAIAAKEMLPREFYDSLFKFAFVRNPWDLQVSSFHHIRRERRQLLNGIDDFNAFLKYKLDPNRAYQYHIDTSIELQSDYVVDLHGNVILDFIGRYEQLQEDFDHICRTIGFGPIALPEKRRARDRADYRHYFTDETAELIARRFQRDIDLFQYRFDPHA